MSQANKELVRRHVEEIFNRQHPALCDELMAEDFVEHAAAPFAQTEPGRVSGPVAMRQTAEWLLAQFPDLHFSGELMTPSSVMKVDSTSLRTRCRSSPRGCVRELSLGRCVHQT